MTWAIDPSTHDRFLLRQRFAPVINRYEFFVPGPDEDRPGQPICFVEQKRFALKEDIRFYSDDTKSTQLMRIKARQRFDPRARYDVTDADGAKIGEIQKVFGKSLLRSTYELYDTAGNEVAVVREKSVAVALVRRIVGIVPYVEMVADWLPIPYHFEFLRNGEVLGTHSRRAWKIRDLYRINLDGDPERTLDRRLVLAIAVGMDALQAR